MQQLSTSGKFQRNFCNLAHAFQCAMNQSSNGTPVLILNDIPSLITNIPLNEIAECSNRLLY